MNGNAATRRYTSCLLMARDTARVRKFAEEKVLDDDDIIATMVMVPCDLDQRFVVKI